MKTPPVNRALSATPPPGSSSFGVAAQRGAVDFAVISLQMSSLGYKHSCRGTEQTIIHGGIDVSSRTARRRVSWRLQGVNDKKDLG
jgi:hypothetical protein